MQNSSSPIAWHHSLKFYGVLMPIVLILGGLLGHAWITEIKGKQVLLDKSHQFIEMVGNNMVSDLMARTNEVAALTRSLALLTEHLPKDSDTFQTTLPPMINFHNNDAIAGGGIWPEPYSFDKDKERHSFFWGRNAHGELEYYDDYNQSESGYLHEEWYVVVRHLEPGRTSWSRSYLDPHSLQPMVTNTAATYDENQAFSGTVTIDLRLEGLQAFADYWQKKTGGYVFITDQFNTFITFPNTDLVLKHENNEHGESAKSMMTAKELAAQQADFLPVAAALEDMNKNILKIAAQMPGYDATIAAQLDKDSYQLSAEQAQLLSAIIANPLVRQSFFKTFPVKNDFINQSASTAYTFFVPESYWKVVIVKPNNEIGTTASSFVRISLFYSFLMAIPLLAVVYFLMDWLFFQRIKLLSKKAYRLGELVKHQQFLGLQEVTSSLVGHGELGLYDHTMQVMKSELISLHRELVEVKEKNRHIEVDYQMAEKTWQQKMIHLREELLSTTQQAVIKVKPKAITATDIPKNLEAVSSIDRCRLIELSPGVLLCPYIISLEENLLNSVFNDLKLLNPQPSSTYLILDTSVFMPHDEKSAAIALLKFIDALTLMGHVPVLSGLQAPLARALADQNTEHAQLLAFNTIHHALAYVQSVLKS